MGPLAKLEQLQSQAPQAYAGECACKGMREPLLDLLSSNFEHPEPDECAICLTLLEGNVAILPCGHCLHHGCLRVLQEHVRPMAGGRLRAPVQCPLCRVPIIGDMNEKVPSLKANSLPSEGALE